MYTIFPDSSVARSRVIIIYNHNLRNLRHLGIINKKIDYGHFSDISKT